MEKFNIIDITSKNDADLIKISKDALLSLSLDEMKTIQSYYKKIKRNPTDVELETLAQTWSEHCKHKTLCGIIEYTDNTSNTKILIDNLLKSTIVKATSELKKKWCLSVFKDNAGVIEFDSKNAVAFKVETHNHPSALEPYGGAGTGIGGVIRDILGVGLGAKPIFNTDVFCFGFSNYPHDKISKGVLHPKRIMKGVVSGVRDYGNRMGIPTINGAVLFDDGFIFNPLVYCGTCGIMPKIKINKKVKSGDIIVAVGGRTGRDGIHGATFSSISLDENTESSAVQIGNPIIEKKVMDVLLVARDKGLYNSITDCGAGGFSSAIGELGEDTGAKVYLDKIPLKYKGLSPWEIWISEAQERMVFAVPKKNVAKLIKLFKDENVEAQVLGEFTKNKKLTIYHEKDKVCELDMDFLHKGLPRIKRIALWNGIKAEENNWTTLSKENHNKTLEEMLSHPNVASKEWIIRQYDHEVQGTNIIKPLTGVLDDGPSDASVVRPIYDSYKGVAVSCGINPEYGKIDSYKMVAANIDEALRNIVCVGGDIEKTAILDNFCFGDPNKPEVLGSIVRASFACYDYSKFFKVPFISGKDSLNNDYLDANGNKLSIPGTMLISAISVIKDIRKCVTMYLKEIGNPIYLIGETKDELGGSLYSVIKKKYDSRVPAVNYKKAREQMLIVSKSIEKGFIRACHDLSEGGLAVAISEMCVGGLKGATIDLNKMKKNKNLQNNLIPLLFSESCTRFLVEVDKKHKKQFESLMKNTDFALIGNVTNSKDLLILNKKETIIKNPVLNLKKYWKTPL